MPSHSEQLHPHRPDADTLAREVLDLSRETLLVNLRFLDRALHRLEPVYRPDGGLSTDGDHLFYDSRTLLRDYQQDERLCPRNLLHLLLHCVFRHNVISTLVNQPLWDLSCDLAVEAAINALGLPSLAAERQLRQKALLQELQTSLPKLTAQKIYDHYQELDLTEEQIGDLRSFFFADSHEGWYLPPILSVEFNQGGHQPSGPEGESSGGQGGGDEGDDGGSQEESIGNEASQPRSDLDQISLSESDTVQFWTETAQQMQTDLETFSRQHGDQNTALFQNLRAVNREHCDYAAFLRKFAVTGETMTLNHEEFDYIFYSYGMQLYDRMPLIQPLEYKEDHRIRDFVIAIDTSGSTSGELVQQFIQKTYNLLLQEENFFRKINLHILQCDEEIQEDVKITCREDFDRYLRTMTLRGFGNTDFRPVFAYVEQLRKAREFNHLKGLIYFTDGEGTFPEQKPDYSTAFVFVSDQDELPPVPPWAIRLVLDPHEIEAL